MDAGPRLSASVATLLRCPICRSELQQAEHEFVCLKEPSAHRFPVVDGIPILINDAASVFAIADFLDRRATTFSPISRLEQVVMNTMPGLDLCFHTRENYARLAAALKELSPHPRVLVVGGGIVGQGMDDLLAVPQIEFIETDVTFGPRTQIISDGHDLPLEDGSVDGVIVQAVLEHVVDPARCVAEIHRVLRKDGLVYAETPFMQPVHMGRYDFTRFTHLGHRRLFRAFSEIDSGAVCGPAMALSWSCWFLLRSFVTSASARKAVALVSRLLFFWIKYLDYLLIDRPGTLDAASGFYFLGRRSDTVLSDRELVRLYRGIH